jgi:hypothetical protein
MVAKVENQAERAKCCMIEIDTIPTLKVEVGRGTLGSISGCRRSNGHGTSPQFDGKDYACESKHSTPDTGDHLGSSLDSETRPCVNSCKPGTRPGSCALPDLRVEVLHPGNHPAQPSNEQEDHPSK